MRRTLLLALFPWLLGAADLKIDHVTAAGTDLKAMQAKLAAIGIRSYFGGPHSNHATQMALTSFPDGSYLELIALQDQPDPQAVAAHYWSPYMRKNAGPAAWAVRVPDVPAEAARLRGAGVEVTPPSRSGRERPDGVRLDWETANVGPGPNGTFFPFIIRDFTPRETRAFPQGKPTNADFSGITKVVIAVRDLDAAVARFRKAYGFGAPELQADTAFRARLAYFKGTPVVLATAAGSGSWIAQRLDEFSEGPCAFVLKAVNPKAYKAASKSAWFGTQVSWFDADALGWHLGFE